MLILKSASPRRREILAGLGLKFSVQPSDVNESQLVNEKPAEFLKRVTIDKLQAGGLEYSAIASDTIVVCQDKILQKPQSREEALSILNSLAGQSHKVMSSVGIWHAGETYYDFDLTEVIFKKWNNAAIEEYVERARPFDKAGAYGIQDKDSPVREFSGSYLNVMGFPIRKFFAFHHVWSRFLC